MACDEDDKNISECDGEIILDQIEPDEKNIWLHCANDTGVYICCYRVIVIQQYSAVIWNCALKILI
jgi:hypothetical protein